MKKDGIKSTLKVSNELEKECCLQKVMKLIITKNLRKETLG